MCVILLIAATLKIYSKIQVVVFKCKWINLENSAKIDLGTQMYYIFKFKNRIFTFGYQLLQRNN